MNRDKALQSIRPQIDTIESGKETNPAEQFQNNTLRPILKFQHDYLWRLFLHYTQKRKGVFDTLSKKGKLEYINTNVRKDQRFKQLLLGLAIGCFTAKEFQYFTENEAENTRRLTDLIVQRLQSEV